MSWTHSSFLLSFHFWNGNIYPCLTHPCTLYLTFFLIFTGAPRWICLESCRKLYTWTPEQCWLVKTLGFLEMDWIHFVRTQAWTFKCQESNTAVWLLNAPHKDLVPRLATLGGSSTFKRWGPQVTGCMPLNGMWDSRPLFTLYSLASEVSSFAPPCTPTLICYITTSPKQQGKKNTNWSLQIMS